MALKKRSKPKVEKPSENGKYFTISISKKKKILGILLIVLSFFIFLSIISYSRSDEARISSQIWRDLLNILANSNELNKMADINNWMGIAGVYISFFFIRSMIGYFSILLPAVIFLWGLRFFKRLDFRILIHLSNFFLLSGIILSSFFGVLSLHSESIHNNVELYGHVGEQLGKIFNRFLGGTGSVILLIAIMIAILIFAFDIKIENIFRFFMNLFNKSVEKIKSEYEAGKLDSKQVDNLDKIKSLREDKKKKKVVLPADTLSPKELLKKEEEETKIRIIRKNEEATHQEPVKGKGKKEKQEIAEKPVVSSSESDKPVDHSNDSTLPDQWNEKIVYTKPTLDLLEPNPKENIKVAEEELTRNAELLKEKLKLFDIAIEDISVTPGPVVTLYEIVPAPGVKISRIVGLENDIALALAARGIRIIAPIPGKSAIGVEIPNAEASIVNARSVLGKIDEQKLELPLALGKQINGDVYYTDLAKMPHMLIAGSTGAGKSVGINMIIASLLYSKSPEDIKLILLDPKKIELSFYKKLRKHFLAVSPDLDEEIITNPQNAVILLKSVEFEMEQRYDKLAKAGVRNVIDYNIKIADAERKPKETDDMHHHHLPYIIVIIDELADLMITAGKEIEEPIARLAQLARAVGIHLVLATQRPSVNVITGVIKANFSARLAYQVATKIDSRTILDMNGAEQLLGKGDMLFLPSGYPKPTRIQNAFISPEEVERITEFISSQPGYSKPYFLPSLYDKKKESSAGFLGEMDPMFEDAARVIVRHQQGSVSLLQRRLKLGYSRAARIVDQLEEAGIVGPNDGSKARTVIVENEEQLETILRNL
ncbi:MAG: DNA translocase FtsK 4TM domain-containing protein [Ignavibacteriaceae bacterium]|nr:DNA translocase FtsK 4TM domain-containing protein [Ignavibacteriaceae bacterium]